MKDQENISQIDQFVIDLVRELRIAMNVSQEALANAMGYERSFIGNVESSNHRAKYNLTHINLIADHFNISPAFFLPDRPIISATKKQKEEMSLEIKKKIESLNRRR